MAENSEERIEGQLEPQIPSRSPAPAGDQIAVHVGEGAAHVAAGKNIIQIGSLMVPRWAALLIMLALAAVAVLVGVAAWFNQQTSENTGRTAAILSYTPTPSPTITPVPTPTPTALPFGPAAEGETLIVVLPFHSTTTTDSEPHKKIWRAIEKLVKEMPEGTVRAAIDPNVVLTADQQAEAERVGNLHNAGMVIWGEDTGVELIASFLNLRQPDFDAADVDIAETDRTQLANPSQYAQFVTHDLPGQMAFLSLFAVGQSYYLKHDYAAAIDAIEAAVAADATADDQSVAQAPAIVQGLSEAYFRLGWLYQEPPADLGAALTAYNYVIELDPQYASAYVNRGLAYYQQGDLDQALADFNKALELDPQLALAYSNRGSVYNDQGDFDQALADFNKALELDPQFALAYNNRGLAYYNGGNLDQAFADYNKALELDPQLALAHNNRGRAYTDQGNLDPALADYNQAIQLEPQFALAYNNRGSVYYEQGDLHQALADYNKAIELDSQLALAYYNRGVVHYDRGEPDQALADWRKASELDPKNPDVYFNLGNVHYEQGDPDQAIADWRKASELNPQDAAAHNQLCWTLASLDQAQEAIGHCEQATALGDEPTYIDSRGLARALLGDYAAAAADFQTYVDWLEANDPDASAEIEQRQAWIKALQGGENPFTPAVLAELRGG